jgi:hypothetical protein
MRAAGRLDSPAALPTPVMPGRCARPFFVGLASMAEIIPFRPRSDIAEEDQEIDLYTAVDAAIRDLREITERWGEEAARLQAEECRRMLERAFDAAC